MARKKRKKRTHLVEAGTRTPEQMRDPFPGRSRLLPRRFAVPSLQSIINRQIEDLRHDNSTYLYDNKLGTVYRNISGTVAETEWQPVRKFDMQRKELPSQMRYVFRDPARTLVCIRRRSRRSVLFAMRKTGRFGARRNRKAVWTDKSRIVCKKRR